MVETADERAGKHYRQVFRNNMQEKVSRFRQLGVGAICTPPRCSKSLASLITYAGKTGRIGCTSGESWPSILACAVLGSSLAGVPAHLGVPA